MNKDARLQRSIKPLSKLLPHLLNSIEYYGIQGDSDANNKE